VAIHQAGPVSKGALEVHHRIRRDERLDYARTAAALDRCADVVSIQFDPDDWGGEDGEYVLDFLQELPIPAVATLHAVHPGPTAHQRSLLASVFEAAGATIVLSHAARTVLASDYGLDPAGIEVLPYGIPDLPNREAAASKVLVGLEDRTVIVGAGLLTPDNGFEQVIEGLPAVTARHPEVVFVIVGMTHPDELRDAGEVYRTALTARAEALGVGAHVRFVDELVGRVQMTRWLQAADVVVTPYLDLGTTLASPLVQALGAGRAVVSTRYLHALELLDEDRGVLVESTPPAIAEGIAALLDDERRRAEIGERAHAHTRSLAWTRAGMEHHRVYERVAVAASKTSTAAEGTQIGLESAQITPR
jgi:glycosyltransferase involved in cell wall biosynthesis